MENHENHISEEALEKLRRKAKVRTYATYILALLVLLTAIPCAYMLLEGEEDNTIVRILESVFGAAVLSCGALGLFWIILARSAYNRFDQAFKIRYVLPLIETQTGFSDIHYVPKAGFDWDEIRNAAVVACGDKRYFESEDLLMGNYEGVPFKFSDVTTKRMVHRNKKNRIEEIFSGQVLGFKQYGLKESDGHLQIFQKEFLSNIKGWTAEHKIETDNALFNKKFQIFSADEHNAYYILTPQVMEKIITFSEAIGEQIAIAFRGGYMFIAICRVRSMFNPYVDQPVSEQTKLILEDISILQKAKEILIMPSDTDNNEN
ncbi:MAG: DUF3137 domain-containing protein [Emergencia sp.]|nr:DUF3137 domain-containing protein [Emergencia sp.]